MHGWKHTSKQPEIGIIYTIHGHPTLTKIDQENIMHEHSKIIHSAITALLAFGITASSAVAAENEKCFGVAKAAQNACNSNANKHSCAGHSKIDNDPNDYTSVAKGSCVKIGGKLQPAGNKPNLSETN